MQDKSLGIFSLIYDIFFLFQQLISGILSRNDSVGTPCTPEKSTVFNLQL